MITTKQEFDSPLSLLKFNNDEKEQFFMMPGSFFVITNGSDQLYKFSRNWADLLGYSYEELSSLSYFNLIHPDDLKDSMAITLGLTARVEGAKRSVNYTNRYITKNNRTVWIQWSSRISPQGLIFSVGQNITELMEKANPQGGLKTKDQLIEDFTETELQIFSFLLSHEGECVTKAELYSHLYGNIVVQDQTINVHISNLRKKIKGSAYTLKTAGKGRWKILNKFELLG